MTYTVLLLNFKSFTSISYKLSLIKCLVDRSFKICNDWNSFHNDIENIKSNLIENAYPPFLIHKFIKKYLDYKFSSNQNQLKDKSDVHDFKLPYIDNFSHHIKIKLSKLCKEFCRENFNIKLAFNSFKIKNHFPYKDPIPNDLKSFLVYKFTCASCSSSYIGEGCRHFKTRIEEHIKKDNKSHIFKHLHSTTTCFFLVVLCISLSSIVFIISTLIIVIFYCLNYTLLLLHLFVTHLTINFIITMQLTYVLGNYYDLYKYH